MKSTLVVELIKILSPTEVEEAKRFLNSPFFNQRKDVIALFQVLAENLHDLDIIPTKAQVFKQLYPDQPFDDQQLRLLQSYLLRLLEKYLSVKEYIGEPMQTGPALLKAYRKKDLNRHFYKTYRKQKQKLDKQQFRNAEYYHALYLLEQEYYQLESQSSRSRALNLQVLENELQHAFISQKLRQACLLLAHQAVYKTSYQIELLEEIQTLARQEKYVSIPAISVYLSCYQALYLTEREGAFLEFKQQLLDHIEHFPREEIRDLFLLALNFCIRKINENQSPYFREALDLYQEGLANKLFIENGYLSRFTYNNVVGIALRLKEISFVETFIQKYRRYLEPSHQEITFNLCAARLEYTRQNYQEALMHLQKADYRDFINNMVAKILQLKIYYELQELDLLEAHLKTMLGFIRRNKKVGYHEKNYRNIVHMTQRLVRYNHFDKKARRQLETDIKQADPLTEKEWLLQQVNGL